MEDYYKKYYQAINDGLLSSEFSIDKKNVDANLFFSEVREILFTLRKEKNRIFFFGNGASSAFANHMALDFTKNGKIISRSISDSALFTALSNDFSYEEAMVEFLNLEQVNSNDLVVTISSSGNSPNIVNVIKHCNQHNISTLSLSGLKNDNYSKSHSKLSIYVPMKTYGIVECIHQIFLHLILDDSMDIFEWNRIDTQNMKSTEFKI